MWALACHTVSDSITSSMPRCAMTGENLANWTSLAPKQNIVPSRSVGKLQVGSNLEY